MNARAALATLLVVASLLAPRARAQEPKDDDPYTESESESESEDEVIDVTVEGERSPRSSALKKEEVRSLPGAFGDPYRAIEALPGVTPIVSGLPYFVVRGAPPANVGYFFDDVRVPALFHIGLGPSVIHPVLVDRVELYPGAYPARYGRFAGAIVAAETAPPIPAWRGEASVRVFDAGAMLSAPLPPDNRGSITVAGRYSYTAAILSLINPDVKLDYWDYQARLHYRVSPHDDVSALVFGAGDFVEEKATEDQPAETLADLSFHRLDLRWDHRPSRATKVRLATTLGLDFFGAERTALRDRLIGVRGQVEHEFRDGAVVRGGADSNIDAYDTESVVNVGSLPIAEIGPSAVLFPSRNDLSGGLWIELSQPAGIATFIPGVRLDYYAFGTNVFDAAVDPRLAVQVRADEHVRLTSTIGLASQPPSFIVAVPGLAASNTRDGLQRSAQQSLSVEVDLPWDLDARATVFQNAFFDQTDPLAALRKVELSFISFNRMLGTSRGLELYLHRPPDHQLSGFVSYTLSRSERVFARERFPAAFDRTHVVQTGVSWDFGHRWRAGTRMVFYTGFPAEASERSIIIIPGERTEKPQQQGRTLPFFRIDVRLEKRWLIAERGYLGLVFEVLNATARREVVDVQCDAVRGCQPVEFGPVVIPSIGVEGGFF